MPASFKSSAVSTICWADFTNKPERPIASGLCSRTAWIKTSGGTLIPRFTT